MDKHLILGVHVTDRLENAARVQQLFTEYGCHIKTRLGLHEVTAATSSPNGIILLELVGAAACRSLVRDLNRIRGIEAKQMVFAHD